MSNTHGKKAWTATIQFFSWFLCVANIIRMNVMVVVVVANFGELTTTTTAYLAIYLVFGFCITTNKKFVVNRNGGATGTYIFTYGMLCVRDNLGRASFSLLFNINLDLESFEAAHTNAFIHI